MTDDEADAAATSPQVRTAVLATVTFDEAARTLRSRAGQPWCDAFLVHLTQGLDDQAGLGGSLAESGRTVVFGRRAEGSDQ